MNKFLKDLEKELKNLNMSDAEITEIIEDHKEMFATASQDGLSDDEVITKFGDPVTVARELFEDSEVGENGPSTNNENSDSSVEYQLDEYNLVKTFPVLSNAVDFEIALVSDDVTISNYDGDSIKIYEKGIKKLEDYVFVFEKETLKIQKNHGKIRIFSFRSDEVAILVLVPNTLKINMFSYHTVSGDTIINGIETSQFKFNCTSGDLEISNVDLGVSKISTVNGDLEMAQIKALSLELSTVNGDVEIEKAIINGDISINTVSGDIELEQVECNSATFKSVSGDLEGNEFYPKEITLKSISGDIEITNKNKDREIKVIAKKTVSGDINIK